MRDVNRIDSILARLNILWKEYPDLRLGQLLLNACTDPQLYYIEDEELISKLERLYLSNNTSEEA